MKPVEEMGEREVDAAVAREIMKTVACDEWEVLHSGGMFGPTYYLPKGFCKAHGGLPDAPAKCCPRAYWPAHYSTDISAAWPVWEWLCQHHEEPHTALIHRPAEGAEGAAYRVAGGGDYVSAFEVFALEACAPTAPLAICRAALKAVRAAS